jgi:hypothetical protein
MNKHSGKRMAATMALASALALSGCAGMKSGGSSELPVYR